MLVPTESLPCRLFLAIIYEHDVNHKPEVCDIATPSEEDRATVIGNEHKKLAKIGDMHADRQTDRHGRHHTPLSPTGDAGAE